jgi:hypothetical protein
MGPFKSVSHPHRKIPVREITEPAIQLEIILIVEPGLLVLFVIGDDIELIELGAKGKSKISPPAEILKMLPPDPEILPDIDGHQAAGSGSKKIAAGQVENGADPAELIVIQPDLGKSQGVLLHFENDLTVASG